jgi:pimeloyl-ACP methyl ester carboxylesterase
MLQQALAERGIRSVSYELAGRQGDGAHLGRYQHEDFSRDALALADHLGLDQWDVVGCSFGSTVTLRLMAIAPSRVRRVVLQGGFAVRRLNWIESGLKTVARFLPGTLGQLPRRREVAQQFDLPQLQGCPPEIFEFLLSCGGQTPCRTAAHRAECLRRIDLRASLPTLPQPVRLLGGVSDPIVPRADEAVLEAGLTDVHRIEFAPGGHYPQYAAPADMAQAIAEFCLG